MLYIFNRANGVHISWNAQEKSNDRNASRKDTRGNAMLIRTFWAG